MINLTEYLETEFEYDVQEQKRGWKIHATVYCVVNALLIVLNVLLIVFTSENFVWFPFPLVGWGIGLAFHYLFGVRWISREVRDHQERIQELAAHKHAA